MREYLDIGCTPPAEDCAQVGSEGYWEQAGLECAAYIALLRRTIGPEPAGAHLAVKSHDHDFGTYLSVACFYDSDVPAAVDYAFRCEAEGPEAWDQEAKQYLLQRRR